MKDNKFIQKIKKHNIFIVSPHPDDAVLSTGMMLLTLKKPKNVTVINCFTKASSAPYTLSARKFLRDCGLYSDGNKLYAKRLREDKEALSRLGVKIINLGLEEALFRKNNNRGIIGKIIPELAHVYPTYKWHVGKSISPADNAPAELKRKLVKYADKNAYYFVPLSIGNHVDHQIVRKVSEEVFTNIIFYSDFPYNVQLNNFGQAKDGQRKYSVKSGINEKKLLIRLYATQHRSLFPNGEIPDHEEVYFADKNI